MIKRQSALGRKQPIVGIDIYWSACSDARQAQAFVASLDQRFIDALDASVAQPLVALRPPSATRRLGTVLGQASLRSLSAAQ